VDLRREPISIRIVTNGEGIVEAVKRERGTEVSANDATQVHDPA
jgi:hypothetical protein